MKLSCIIVDDEPMARKLLEENIRQLPFLEVVKTCKNTFEATEALQDTPVDLMFLDIQIPGMLGTNYKALDEHKKRRALIAPAVPAIEASPEFFSSTSNMPSYGSP